MVMTLNKQHHNKLELHIKCLLTAVYGKDGHL